jgi:hypothetical protein
MPVAMIQTPFEAGRLFANDYAGKKARLCLATTTSGSPGASSTTAQWDAVERSGNGYARCEWTIPSGSFNATPDRFEAGSQQCVFTASSGGAGLTWNAAYLVIGTISGSTVTWNTGVSFYLAESPSISLAAGASRTYTVSLFTDGFTVTA